MQLTLTKSRQCIVKFIDWQVTTIFFNLRRTLTISTRQGSATTGLAQASLQAWQLGLQALAGDATMLFYMTEEGSEGRNAYVEKRKPDFRQYPWRP